MTETLDPVEAHGLEAAVAEHLGDLGVLLPVLLEDQLTLEALVLVLAPPPVLSSLSFVLRHLLLGLLTSFFSDKLVKKLE